MREKLLKAIEELQRYRPYTAGGCECCGTWAEMDEDSGGEWLKRDDVIKLLKRTNQ